MAAPTVLDMDTRSPAGIPLQDGYQTLIGLTLDPTIKLWEKTVTPPGVDGGDAVDFTTMHNTLWRTKAPRNLQEMTDISCTCNYDPDVYTNLLTAVNRADTITVLFPDGSKVAVYGYLQKFEPSDISEGDPPEASCTFVVTNWDPSADTEAGPTVEEVAGS